MTLQLRKDEALVAARALEYMLEYPDEDGGTMIKSELERQQIMADIENLRDLFD